MESASSLFSRKLHQPRDVSRLYKVLPKTVKCSFDIISKIGTGTFSNVFLAKFKAAGGESFAFKHISSTTHPKRILNELKCLQILKGINNVIGVESCLHFNGQTILVLPLVEHQKFDRLMWEMTMEDIKVYMRGLLTALKHTHSHNIIHRDVKPSNFLYNNKTKVCGLVDFGLAEEYSPDLSTENPCTNKRSETKTALLSKPTDIVKPLRSPPLYEIFQNHFDIAGAAEEAPPVKKQKIQVYLVEELLNCKELIATPEKIKMTEQPSSRLALSKSCRSGRDISTQSRQPSYSAKCSCLRKFSVCKICLARKSSKYSRAGTSGFRPPEVLFQCKRQTAAVDIWSAGVILLSLLCRCQSFFYPTSDLKSLVQICRILGTKKMQKAAKACGNTLLVSIYNEELELKKLVISFRSSENFAAKDEEEVLSMLSKKSKTKFPVKNGEIGNDMIDLLECLLDPNPHTRITADAALTHKYLRTL